VSCHACVLSSENCTDYFNRDIVDTERFIDGNVWKMLLASISKWFDHSDKIERNETPTTPMPMPKRGAELDNSLPSNHERDLSPLSPDTPGIFLPFSLSSCSSQPSYRPTQNWPDQPYSQDHGINGYR
jgi:hypothetical protein